MDSSIYTSEGALGLLIVTGMMVLMCLRIIGTGVQYRHDVQRLRTQVKRLRADLLARHEALRRLNSGEDDLDAEAVETAEAPIPVAEELPAAEPVAKAA